MKKYLLLIGVLAFLPKEALAASACVDLQGGVRVCYDDITITTGGAAQNLFGGVVPKTGWEIHNPDASEDCWVSDSATAAANAQGSRRVVANGGWYETPPGKRPPAAVSVICATTGHKLTASRW